MTTANSKPNGIFFIKKNMGLSNRQFISQPLEQRIIPICNKTKFSDFRNNQKKILKHENFSGKSPLR